MSTNQELLNKLGNANRGICVNYEQRTRQSQQAAKQLAPLIPYHNTKTLRSHRLTVIVAHPLSV